MLAVVGCSAARLSATIAQTVLAPYSFVVRGEARGVLGTNARFLALDADVDVVAEYYAPSRPGGPAVLQWRGEFQRGRGKRAYRVVLGADGAFVSVIAATWEEARQAMPFLPE
jgi:hypothetical protein